MTVSTMNSYQAFGLYIDGAWGPSTSRGTKAVLDPATGDTLGEVPDAVAQDLDRALEAATKGFSAWRCVQPWERAAKLRRIAELIRERVEPLARFMSGETGKPLLEGRAEWGATADQFEWYAEETKRIYGQLIEGRQADVRMAVIYQPIGVVVAFTAWNFPAILPARKIAAALAAGCSVIIKPAGEAPGSCMGIVQACHEAGLPAGAVDLVTGNSRAIAEHLIGSPIVRKVSLTGSVPVGKEILRLAAQGVKRVTMELGGHAPVLVFPDADVLKAAEAAASAKFRNCGQVCISPSRFYVHEDVYEPFSKRFVEVARGLKLGRGSDEGVTMGPLANARGLETTKKHVADALARGAALLTGGRTPSGLAGGFFFEPTVLGRVPDNALVMLEEPFGPVAPIATFHDFEDGIAKANSLPFGLASYVFSRSLGTATLAAEAIEAGMVGVNDMMLATAEAPFGGVKESGMGREGGALGILDYLQPKYIKTKLQ